MSHTSLLSASDLQPYRNIRTDQERKFSAILVYLGRQDLAVNADSPDTSAYAIQVVIQENFGPVESKRYFATAALTGDDTTEGGTFREISEEEMLAMDLKKLNSFKNFKSKSLNKFYELNLYVANPAVSRHGEGSNLNAKRPAAAIDLA